MKRSKNNKNLALTIILLIGLIISSFYKDKIENFLLNITRANDIVSYKTIEEIPDYNGTSYVLINDGIPTFTKEELQIESLEEYGNLDILGRTTYAYALVSNDTMPTTERESIGVVKPTGWHTVKYDNIDGKYLYNRCHLIGYQLAGENANPNNLITCTRKTNTGIMLEYENKVASYIKKTNNHVLYRVTPIYKDNELIARGIVMEAYSIEDNGKGIKFNIYIYNVQDGIEINYKTGESKMKEEE